LDEVGWPIFVKLLSDKDLFLAQHLAPAEWAGQHFYTTVLANVVHQLKK
jgi:hypothetical protein